MQRNPFSIDSQDGTKLHGTEWLPDGSPHGELLLIHGYAEHLGRYSFLGENLAHCGWRVRGVDLRGHGQSAGKRGCLRSWQDYVRDVEAAAGSLTPPFTVLAHSMGGPVALDFIRHHPQSVRALILSSPLLGVAVPAPAWKEALGKVVSRWIPDLRMKSGIDPSWISRDPVDIEEYAKDALIFDTASARWFTEMTDAVERCQQNAGKFSTPMLLHAGEGDRIVSTPASERFFEAYGGPKEKHIWPRGQHELFHDLEKEQVWQVTSAWLRNQ